MELKDAYFGAKKNTIFKPLIDFSILCVFHEPFENFS